MFAPGGIDVMVMRSLESTRPARVTNLRSSRGPAPRKPRSRRSSNGAK
jgi:hypothetical protein